jgi:phosphate butyryltransferase
VRSAHLNRLESAGKHESWKKPAEQGHYAPLDLKWRNELFRNFEEIREAARGISDARVAVPMGIDRASLEALITACEEGLATSVIVGPSAAVRESMEEMGRILPDGIDVIDCQDETEAAEKAVGMIRAGEASMLMKGLMKTSLFQKAILDKEYGLRTDMILSHVAVVHVPGYGRLISITDGGMNIRPDEEAIIQIVRNAAGVMKSLGIIEPRVALLAAIEVPNEKMPETILFARIAEKGIPGVHLEGPIAVDGAIDPEAAGIKGMNGPVAGRADILVCPDIACGNIFAKGLMYMANAEIGGLIAGAAAPVVMLSRADRPITKLNSLALGVVASAGVRNG